MTFSVSYQQIVFLLKTNTSFYVKVYTKKIIWKYSEGIISRLKKNTYLCFWAFTVSPSSASLIKLTLLSKSNKSFHGVSVYVKDCL